MHYVTCRLHKMQKHKFGITCPDALFMEIALSPPEHEKYFIDVSHPERTGMHYVTQRSHQMQKHKFRVMCPTGLSIKSDRAHPSMKKFTSTSHALDAPQCTT
jgi:hypothetical protein